MKKEGGFTLVEVIITISLVTFGLLGSALLLNGVNIANKRAKQKLLAVQAAQRQIESVRNTGYNSISSGTFTPAPAPVSGATGNVAVCEGATSCNDANLGVDNGIKKITVTINWTDKIAQSVQLVTYVTDGGIDRQ